MNMFTSVFFLPALTTAALEDIGSPLVRGAAAVFGAGSLPSNADKDAGNVRDVCIEK